MDEETREYTELMMDRATTRQSALANAGLIQTNRPSGCPVCTDAKRAVCLCEEDHEPEPGEDLVYL